MCPISDATVEPEPMQRVCVLHVCVLHRKRKFSTRPAWWAVIEHLFQDLCALPGGEVGFFFLLAMEVKSFFVRFYDILQRTYNVCCVCVYNRIRDAATFIATG